MLTVRVRQRLGDGAAHLVIGGLQRPEAVAAALPARGVAAVHHGRLDAVTRAEELLAAVTSAERTTLALPLRRALAAFAAPPPDLDTPSGVLPTSARPLIMGVLNVTPDSFSDGGRYARTDIAVRAGHTLAAAGADLVDVGGESTRPGAAPVPVEVEVERVVPVVTALAAAGVRTSVDTSKAAVARAAVEAGAVLVNDVSAGAFDPELLPCVAELGVPYVLMHLRGTPRSMQRDPRYLDVVAEVFDHLAIRLAELEAAGIARERVLVDPGLGFGKTTAHNLALVGATRELTSLGRPVLIGASRKSFLGAVTGVDDPGDRLEASLAVAALAVAGGARLLRVHDVAETRRAVALAHAVATARPTPGG